MSESPKERIPEENDTTDAPLSMAASVVLTNLPKDASKALETAGNLTVQKGTCSPSHCAEIVVAPNVPLHVLCIHPPLHMTTCIHPCTHPQPSKPPLF